MTHRWDPTLYDQPYLILPYLTHRWDPTLYDQPYLILPYLTHRWDPTLYDQPYLILPYLTHRWDTNRLPERDVHRQMQSSFRTRIPLEVVLPLLRECSKCILSLAGRADKCKNQERKSYNKIRSDTGIPWYEGREFNISRDHLINVALFKLAASNTNSSQHSQLTQTPKWTGQRLQKQLQTFHSVRPVWWHQNTALGVCINKGSVNLPVKTGHIST